MLPPSAEDAGLALPPIFSFRHSTFNQTTAFTASTTSMSVGTTASSRIWSIRIEHMNALSYRQNEEQAQHPELRRRVRPLPICLPLPL